MCPDGHCNDVEVARRRDAKQGWDAGVEVKMWGQISALHSVMFGHLDESASRAELCSAAKP